MKIGEAISTYRPQLDALWDKKVSLTRQQKELEQKRKASVAGTEEYSEQAATLELTLNEVNARYDETKAYFDKVMAAHTMAWNAEVAKQQGDAMEEYGEDLAKIMEIARRISKGGIVPYEDEKKLMEYSMELYMSAKNLAVLAKEKDRQKYDSLWDDDKERKQYDPQGAADNAEITIDAPEVVDVNSVTTSSTENAGTEFE